MKALFIGGTGTISSAITRLVAQTPGWELFLLNRGNRNHDLPEGVISYMLEHPELQVEDQAFDAWCDRIVAAMEQARLSLID